MRIQSKSSPEKNPREKVGKDALEASLRLLSFVDGIFIFVVVLGVAGELVIHILESKTSKQLVVLQDLESEQLRLKIADANKATEELRNENFKLRERLAPRSLSEEQQRELLKLLSNGPKGDVSVMPKAFDEEAEAYAGQITFILISAGFTVKDNPGQRPFSFGTVGAFMVVKDMTNPPAIASFIQGCFRKVGVELPGFAMPGWYDGTQNKFGSETVIIGVAAKPLASPASQDTVNPSTQASVQPTKTSP